MYIYAHFLNHNYGVILHVIRKVKVISINFPEIRDASMQSLFLLSLWNKEVLFFCSLFLYNEYKKNMLTIVKSLMRRKAIDAGHFIGATQYVNPIIKE